MTDTTPTEARRAPDLQMIPIDRIEAIGNVRETDDKELQELVASVRLHGILEPVLVTPRTTKFTGQIPESMKSDLEARSLRYRLVFGFRRLRAAQLAGLQDVPAQVRDMTVEEVLEAQLVENLQREDLDAIEEALAFRRHLETTKQTQAQLAARIGKSQPYIANRLRLLGLRPEVQADIRRGMLTPSAAEVLLEIPKEASGLQGQVAKKIAGKDLPVQDVKREVRWQVERWTQDRQHRDAAAEARKHKFPKCPFKEQHYGEIPIAAHVLELEGRTILACSDGDYSVHRWDADTGERYYTPAEQKELERRKAEQSRSRRESAKKAKTTRSVRRDYAVFFSRARVNAWAQALLEAEFEAGISSLTFERVMRARDGYAYEDYSRRGTFNVDAKRTGLPAIALEPVEVPDGNGGKFFSRVRIGEFRSTPSDQDNVVEGPDAAIVGKARRTLLAFQAKKIGVRQGEKDLWPVRVGTFRLGEKVRIGEKAAWSSYRGKQGVVLAFDMEHSLSGDTRGHASHTTRSPLAVLNIAAAHKRHWLSVLEPLGGKKA